MAQSSAECRPELYAYNYKVFNTERQADHGRVVFAPVNSHWCSVIQPNQATERKTIRNFRAYVDPQECVSLFCTDSRS
jgi:hypothetical protein